jgi:hypothetical protein
MLLFLLGLALCHRPGPGSSGSASGLDAAKCVAPCSFLQSSANFGQSGMICAWPELSLNPSEHRDRWGNASRSPPLPNLYAVLRMYSRTARPMYPKFRSPRSSELFRFHEIPSWNPWFLRFRESSILFPCDKRDFVCRVVFPLFSDRDPWKELRIKRTVQLRAERSPVTAPPPRRRLSSLTSVSESPSSARTPE